MTAKQGDSLSAAQCSLSRFLAVVDVIRAAERFIAASDSEDQAYDTLTVESARSRGVPLVLAEYDESLGELRSALRALKGHDA